MFLFVFYLIIIDSLFDGIFYGAFRGPTLRMRNDCQRCQEIVSWLGGRGLGHTVRCPLCEAIFTRDYHCVVDEAGGRV